MFIKPFKIKNQTQIKGSDLKRIKARLSKQYPKLTEENLTALLPNKSAYQSIKIETYSGENVTVLSKDKLPVFFEIADQERLLPTVYSLWQAPELVPYFTTFPPVLLKLANGADLMVPGIIREGSDLRAFGRYKKDEICAVNLTSNKSAVGVGLVARSSEDMYMSGGHGIGVKMLHVFGDNLWGIEPTVIQQVPLSGPTKSIPTLTNDSDFPALGSEPPKKEEVAEKLANLEINNDQETEGNQEESENLDDVLKGIFLGSLKSNKKQLSSQLPLLVSTFYPNYVQKEMQADRSVNIKETSFKKVSTFIKKMSESGYITLKEETKGIEKIVAVNFDHPDIINFAMKKKEKSANDSSVQEGPQLLLTKMTELYVVNEPTKALFNCLAVPVGKSLDSTQVKNYIKDYVCRNKLFDNTTKHVTLDENLKVIVGAITQASTVSLENLNDIVLDRMDNTFEMRSQSKPQAKGGKKPIITITTATRSGNKKVTLIENLEAFGINVAEFSKSIKQAVQASTTMTKANGTNKDQFLVQGNHVRFIYDLLVNDYKIQRNNITGLEFAKKEKKKK